MKKQTRISPPISRNVIIKNGTEIIHTSSMTTANHVPHKSYREIQRQIDICIENNNLVKRIIKINNRINKEVIRKNNIGLDKTRTIELL